MHVPKKWWWVVGIAVPLTAALIGIIPKLIVNRDSGTMYVDVAGDVFQGTIAVYNVTVVGEQAREKSGKDLPESVLKMLRQATDFIESGEFERAIPLLHSAQEAAPVPAVYNNIGAAYLATGNHERAKQYFDQALAGSPDEETVRFNLDQFGRILDHFTYEPVREAAEHTHYTVVFEKGHGEDFVGHLPVLIIRARGDYRDIRTRAKYVAERLNTAVVFLQKGANFRLDQEDLDWSIVIVPPGGHPIRVLNVHSEDAVGESRRCGREVNPHLLARYWEAWLEDFVELFVRHRMPSNLIGTHSGLVLKLIYTQAKTLGEGVVDEKSIHESVDLLADSHWRSLNELAGCVVREFE